MATKHNYYYLPQFHQAVITVHKKKEHK